MALPAAAHVIVALSAMAAHFALSLHVAYTLGLVLLLLAAVHALRLLLSRARAKRLAAVSAPTDASKARPERYNLVESGFDARGVSGEAGASEDFDVVIIGGGIGGLMQALHMARHLPSWARVAVVEPRDPQRRDTAKDLKWGEAMVEVSSLFFAKDLGLQEYMLETHCTKHGLFFHWAKDASPEGSTASISDDYHSIYSPMEPSITSYMVNRAKLERDLTAMLDAHEQVTFVRGRVKAVHLGTGGKTREDAAAAAASGGGASSPAARARADSAALGADTNAILRLKAVDVAPVNAAEEARRRTAGEATPGGKAAPGGAGASTPMPPANRRLRLRGRHIIDASGRSFVLGTKMDNLLRGPRHTFGIMNGAVLFRVRAVDRAATFDTYHPEASGHSYYYGTNHFFGHGHWVWVIPIEPGSRDLSVGIVYHRQVITPDKVNTCSKALAFLRHHHEALAAMVESGSIVDFHHLPELAHCSKTYLSPDGWYVIGEASANWDPLYSTGIVITAMQVEMVTEAVRQELAGVEREPWTQRVREWDELCGNKVFGYGTVIWKHHQHLGHASAMSWRIYFDNIVYFSMALPFQLAKYHVHLDPKHWLSDASTVDIGTAIGASEKCLYALLDEVAERDINAGFMNPYYSGELPGTAYSPLYGWDSDALISTGKHAPRRLNLFKYYGAGMWYLALVVLTLGSRVRGGVLPALRHWPIVKTALLLVATSAKMWCLAMMHSLETYGLPSNVWRATGNRQFRGYKFSAKATPDFEPARTPS